jgi:hypothetical protein
MGDHEIEKDRSKRAQRRQAERKKRERREEARYGGDWSDMHPVARDRMQALREHHTAD